MLILSQKEQDRFESKFTKTEECWLWKTDKGRHASFLFRNKFYRAHRFSFVLYRGDIPENVCVCHKCDNPSCINPDHLFLGTVLENMQDMIKKGRARFGGRLSNLRESDVVALREKSLAHKYTQRELAKEFNISQSSVSKIINQIVWKRTIRI